MSWDDLDAVSNDIRDAQQGRNDISRLMLRVFGSEDGEKLLEWMKETYVNVLVAVPGADSSHAYFAEGQRNVVRNLMNRIKHAKEM
jgi:hypothetical protein